MDKVMKQGRNRWKRRQTKFKTWSQQFAKIWKFGCAITKSRSNGRTFHLKSLFWCPVKVEHFIFSLAASPWDLKFDAGVGTGADGWNVSLTHLRGGKSLLWDKEKRCAFMANENAWEENMSWTPWPGWIMEGGEKKKIQTTQSCVQWRSALILRV